jgi:hypothetical protein
MSLRLTHFLRVFSVRFLRYTGHLGSNQFVARLEEKLGRRLEIGAGGRAKQIADRCGDQL